MWIRIFLLFAFCLTTVFYALEQTLFYLMLSVHTEEDRDGCRQEKEEDKSTPLFVEFTTL